MKKKYTRLAVVLFLSALAILVLLNLISAGSKKEFYSCIAQIRNDISEHLIWHSDSLNSYSPPSSSPSSSFSTTTTTTTTSSTHIHCSTFPCLQFLRGPEKKIYSECRGRTAPPCKCRFVERTGRNTVALVSLPGSGNTWVRGILETATGICSGSIYCDEELKEGGFCAESLVGSNLIVVKTHESSLSWRGGKRTTMPVFDQAIFLIRNPFSAIIAEWSRQQSMKYAVGQNGSIHVKYLSSRFFGEDNIRNETIACIISCVYTSQVRTRDHPSRDHGHGSDAGPAFTRIRARK